MPRPHEALWQSRCLAAPLRKTVSFHGDDLVLGHDTVLYKLDARRSDIVSLCPDAARERMIALLSIAGRGDLAKAALMQLAAAITDWRRGDRGLAAIRLAFAPLPRLRDHADAHRLFLAETALNAGVSPDDLLAELGYTASRALLKFDPNQPRVPAGSGEQSGRWTSGGEGVGTASTPDRLKPTPVLFTGGDVDEHQAVDEWWRLDSGGKEKQRVEEGKPLLPPTVAPDVPAAPRPSPAPAPSVSLPEAGPSGLGTPTPTMGSAPRSTTVPAIGQPTPLGPASSATSSDDKGPACPKPQNDRPNGPNPTGDEFEYRMSLLINPNNPTPKYSLATPSVTSQAYYLPSPTPDGKTSFDDCKQDDTPTVLNIPDLKPGDMFEHKAGDWGWQLFYQHATGFEGISKQIENQNAAVIAEGRGRQIYYCLDNQRVASQAEKMFNDFQNSHFLVCH